METIKNNKKYILSNMNKLMIIMIFFILSISHVYSSQYNQEYILNWNFDEVNGDIAFDSSGNNLFGILNGGANFEPNGDGVAYGLSDIDFDGNNDFVSTSLTNLLNNEEIISFSLWFRPDGGQEDVLFSIYAQDGNLFEMNLIVDPDNPSNLLSISGITNNAISYDFMIDNSGNNYNSVYHHVVISINTTSNDVTLFRNGVEINTINIPQISFENSLSMRLGVDRFTNFDFDGDMDEFKIFNFIPNSTQIQDLYLLNTMTLFVAEEETNSEETQSLFIDYSPTQNSSISNPINIIGNLNVQSTCDIYINNKLDKTLNNIISFNEEYYLTQGQNNYLIYCSYIENGTKFFEVTPLTTFNINEGEPTEATFIINPLDFDLTKVDLWVTSPCLEEGYSAIGTDMGKYRPQYNPNGAYFSEVVNGRATINVSSGINEFCLHNGRIIVNEDGKTTNYDVVQSLGRVELGDVDIPRENAVFSVNIEQFQIYEIYDPKAYGKTWSGVIGGLILVLMGGLVILVGARNNNGKIVVAGALIFMAGFGISTAGLVGILI